ncbi:MAG: START domain-containing protein [Bacteroidetes bacterium]|nr:START domain-containing protein [Bacteroidota bacterium]
MKYCRFIFLSVILTIAFSYNLKAQSWDFIKEKNGIKIYTRKEPGKSLKSYKGVADINAPAERVFAMLEDVHHTEWWDKNINQIQVLQYEKNKRAQYYLVYDLPWPVTDRDLCVDVRISIDPLTDEHRITAVPLPGVIQEHPDKIRIKEYRQTWTVNPAGKDKTHVVLEGLVDPAGTIPDWIINMLIVDSPFEIINGIKQLLEKQPER